MGEDQQRTPWVPSAGDSAAARQRAIELRLEEIAAEIARLRREREEAIQDFRAFTGRPSGGAGDDAAGATGQPLGVRQPVAGARGSGTLETYAAELADRGPLVSSRFGLFEAPNDESQGSPPRHAASRRRSRGVLRIVVPVLVLGAVAAGASAIVGRWAGRAPAGGREQAPPEAAEVPAIPSPDVGVLSATGAGEPSSTPVATSGTSPGRPLTIELTTIREVWLRTVVDDGPASPRVLAAGETLTIEADRFVEVRLGDAGAVTLRVNGEDRGPIGRDGEVLTRRFDADRDRPEP